MLPGLQSKIDPVWDFRQGEKKKGKSRSIDSATFLFCFHVVFWQPQPIAGVQFVNGAVC